MAGVYKIFFDMMQHGHWSFQEIHALPISLRNWFYDKLVEHLKPKE